jgi:hypothetical protein
VGGGGGAAAEEEEEEEEEDEDKDERDEDEEVVEPEKTSANSRVVFAAPKTKSKLKVASQNCSGVSGSQWQQRKVEQLARKEEQKRQARIDQAWLDEQSVREPLPSVLLPLNFAHLYSQVSPKLTRNCDATHTATAGRDCCS